MISDAALREFKEVWLHDFGAEIPDEVAVEEAINLLTMFNSVYRPLKESDVYEYENQDGKDTTNENETPRDGAAAR